MRQNKNITIAYDISKDKDRKTLDCLEGISKTIGRSISYVAKELLELGLIKNYEILNEHIKDETK